MQSSKATSLKPIAFFSVSGSELITKPFLEPTTYPDFSLTQLAYIYGLLQFSPQQSSPSLFHIAQILFARHGTQSSSTQYSGGLCGHGGGWNKDCGHDRGNISRGKPRVWYKICQGFNHLELQCYQPLVMGSLPMAHIAYAHTILTQPLTTSQWFPNTGTTYHVTLKIASWPRLIGSLSRCRLTSFW